MTEALLIFARFLVAHGDLVNALMDAIDGGADRESVLKAIRASMVAVSDEQMKRELAPIARDLDEIEESR
ncbi:MAG TPA: hypothetical protein VNJ04_05095 [Gemmatimonadaceae bacterium]|nr:hypothetical protein [Gemmatimonadaceae bacterium]